MDASIAPDAGSHARQSADYPALFHASPGRDNGFPQAYSRRQMKTRTRRVLGWGAAILVLALVLACLPFNPRKWSAAEIATRVDLLNEKAAIDTPHHDLGKKIREQNLALFEKVESGQQLTEGESADYRVLYQSILRGKQSEFKKIDHELVVMTNYMPRENNNVGTQGIEGSHDHHDASAAANLAALRRDLERLERASGVTASFTRVNAAIAAWKDLDDVILHMATAPQTKSVPRAPEAASDELQARFEPMMLHYKRAQFAPVNSPAYATEVHAALDSYDALVLRVQDRIHASLGPMELSLAGRWGSWRSLAPSLRGVTSKRIPRKPAGQPLATHP
jgi:hypothetical protein